MLSNASGRRRRIRHVAGRGRRGRSWRQAGRRCGGNQRPCWSEEAVSSELRERLDRWSEGWLAAAGGGEIREVKRREKKIK